MTRLWTAASVLFVAAAASSPHPPQMPPADLPPGGRGVYTNEGSFDVGTGESSIMCVSLQLLLLLLLLLVVVVLRS